MEFAKYLESFLSLVPGANSLKASILAENAGDHLSVVSSLNNVAQEMGTTMYAGYLAACENEEVIQKRAWQQTFFDEGDHVRVKGKSVGDITDAASFAGLKNTVSDVYLPGSEKWNNIGRRAPFKDDRVLARPPEGQPVYVVSSNYFLAEDLELVSDTTASLKLSWETSQQFKQGNIVRIFNKSVGNTSAQNFIGRMGTVRDVIVPGTLEYEKLVEVIKRRHPQALPPPDENIYEVSAGAFIGIFLGKDLVRAGNPTESSLKLSWESDSDIPVGAKVKLLSKSIGIFKFFDHGKTSNVVEVFVPGTLAHAALADEFRDADAVMFDPDQTVYKVMGGFFLRKDLEPVTTTTASQEEFKIDGIPVSQEEFQQALSVTASDNYFDATPDPGRQPEEQMAMPELNDQDLGRTNPKRFDARTDWYQHDNEHGHDSDVSNRYDHTPGVEARLRIEEIDWEIENSIPNPQFKAASLSKDRFEQLLLERVAMVRLIEHEREGAFLRLGFTEDPGADKYKTRNIEMYRNRAKMTDDGAQIFWSGRSAQEKRFEALCQVGDMKGDSLLDVGCGHGDLLGYLEQHGTKVGRYVGVDLISEAIEKAKEKYPGAEFEVRDIERKPFKPGEFDYVIGCGIFAVESEKWGQYTMTLLMLLFQAAQRAVAVNFLWDKALAKDRQLHYTNPEEVLEMISKIAPVRTEVKTDYLDNDFSVFIYKDEK